MKQESSKSLSEISCIEFIEFLNDNGYDIKKENPKHVSGQGYSPPPFYTNVNTEYVIKDFLDKKNIKNVEGKNN